MAFLSSEVYRDTSWESLTWLIRGLWWWWAAAGSKVADHRGWAHDTGTTDRILGRGQICLVTNLAEDRGMAFIT